MYSEWAVVEFSHLNVEDVEAGTELIEFDLGEARFVIYSGDLNCKNFNRELI